jgi:hypothetical protein
VSFNPKMQRFSNASVVGHLVEEPRRVSHLSGATYRFIYGLGGVLKVQSVMKDGHSYVQRSPSACFFVWG